VAEGRWREWNNQGNRGVAEGRWREWNNQDTLRKRTEGNNQRQGRQSQGQEVQGNRGHERQTAFIIMRSCLYFSVHVPIQSPLLAKHGQTARMWGCIRGDLCVLWPADIPECISHQQPETIADEKINNWQLTFSKYYCCWVTECNFRMFSGEKLVYVYQICAWFVMIQPNKDTSRRFEVLLAQWAPQRRAVSALCGRWEQPDLGRTFLIAPLALMSP